MQISEKIKNLLKQENKNIVFYFDADGSMQEEILEIEASGIRVLKVNQNYFELKYLLEFELQGKQIFLYHNFPKPNDEEIKKYALLDLLIANTELRLDDASEFLSTYNLSIHHLSFVKKYIKQLKTKTHQKKLIKILDPDHFSESKLKLGLVSVALGFNTISDRNSCMAKWLSIAVDERAFNKLNKSIEELELDTDILNWFNNLLDTKFTELNVEIAKKYTNRIKYNILTTYIDKPTKEDNYTKLKLYRTADLNKLQAFFQDWVNHSTLVNSIKPVFNILGKDVKSSNVMEWYGVQQEYGYYSDEMINILIKSLYSDINENPLKTKDYCIKWMRSSYLSEEQHQQISFLFYTAGVYSILESYNSFKFNKAEEFINEYTNELHKVDLNYRKAVTEFDNVRDRLYEFEDSATSIFNELNKKYDRFIIDLNVEWQKMLNEINFDYSKINIDKQFDFYKNNIKDFDYKVVVIISDALRYELGHELYKDLLADSKNNLSIEPNLASIPSYTNLGMSNLLPNKGITVEKGDHDLVFKINGKTTVSNNRASILQMAEPESATIDYPTLRKMTKQEKRTFFKNSRIIYVYHDRIDNEGDKKGTEYNTPEASIKALEDIKWMIRNISGEMSIAHIMVTSDHGFLFNYTELKEKSREKLPKIKGYSREHTRFVVSEEFDGKVDGYQLNLKDTTNIDTDLKIAIPRAINRYRKQGNIGVQFVHGGASLQELITPVIKFYKHKKENQNTVTFKRIDNTKSITTGSMKITLLQDQPVSNEQKSIEVIFGLYDDSGNLYSNEVEIHFNSTSNNPKLRVFDVILSLNTKGSNASFCYLKAFNKQDKNRLNPLGINDLIKISTYEKDEF